MKNKKTFTLTLSALLSALSFTVMYLGTVTGILDMSACVLCGIFTVIMMIECGKGASWTAVAVCGVLCFVLLPDKTSAILYVTVGALYPLMRTAAHSLPKIWSYIVKCAAAVVIILLYVGSVFLFIPTEATVKMIPVGILLGVPCFIMYDVLLTRIPLLYEYRLRRYITRYRRK